MTRAPRTAIDVIADLDPRMRSAREVITALEVAGFEIRRKPAGGPTMAGIFVMLRHWLERRDYLPDYHSADQPPVRVTIEFPDAELAERVKAAIVRETDPMYLNQGDRLQNQPLAVTRLCGIGLSITYKFPPGRVREPLVGR